VHTRLLFLGFFKNGVDITRFLLKAIANPISILHGWMWLIAAVPFIGFIVHDGEKKFKVKWAICCDSRNIECRAYVWVAFVLFTCAKSQRCGKKYLIRLFFEYSLKGPLLWSPSGWCARWCINKITNRRERLILKWKRAKNSNALKAKALISLRECDGVIS